MGRPVPGGEVSPFLQGVDRLLVRGLDGATLRHRALAHNLANVETPGFRRYDVRFRDALAEAAAAPRLELTRTHPRHLPRQGPLQARSPAVVREGGTVARNDNNNVDLDREMAFLAENALYASSLTQLLAARLQLVRTAVREGR